MKLLGWPILLAILFSFTGCSSEQERQKKYQNEVSERYINTAKRTIYFKDTRTGLCFASLLLYNTTQITYVPCTKEVEALLINK